MLLGTKRMLHTTSTQLSQGTRCWQPLQDQIASALLCIQHQLRSLSGTPLHPKALSVLRSDLPCVTDGKWQMQPTVTENQQQH